MRRLPLGAVLGVTALTFLVGYLQKSRCHRAGWVYERDIIFGDYCYSDIPTLFQSRGLIDGIFPYSPEAYEHPLEYPVLTGIVMDATADVARFLAAGGDVATLSRTYFAVNVVVLLAFAGAMVAGVWGMLRATGGRESDVLFVAAAPVLALTGTINWDLVAVAAAVLAVLAWTRERPWLAGVLIGLGTAAKLFPVFILGPLLVLCLRSRRLGDLGRVVVGAIGAWLAANLPIILLYPDGWLVFWRFNADRGAEFGSLWYALQEQGHPVPALNWVGAGALVALCAGIAALLYFAPHPPTLAQGTLFVLAAFLVTNKVYSPQYVLWLLPFAVLAYTELPAGRLLRDWLIWQTAEVFYWVAIWRYLAGTLGEHGWVYPVSIYVRVAVTLVLCASVLLSSRSSVDTGVSARVAANM